MTRKYRFPDFNLKIYTKEFEPTKNHGIQMLRGIAVLSVVIYHLQPNWLSAGYLGVDVFLVISGYLVIPKISRITEGKEVFQEFLAYFKSRINRIIPPLSATLILFSLPVLFLENLQSLERSLKQMWASLFSIGNLGAYLFSGNYFSTRPNPFVHTWSLAVEMQFYVIMPLIFILTKRALNGRLNAVKLIITAGLFSVTLFFWPQPLYSVQEVFGIKDHFTFMYFDLVPRIWEFALGGLVALSPFTAEKLLKLISKLTLNYLLFFLILSITFFSAANLPQVLSIPTVNLFTVMAILKAKSNKSDNARAWLPLKYLGDISYSLYLVHMPTLYLVHETADALNLPSIVSLTTGLLTSFIVALFIYWLVEASPKRLFEYKFFSPSTSRSFALWFTSLISLCAITFIYSSNESIANRLVLSKEYAGWADPNCERDSFSGPPCKYGNEHNSEILLLGDSRAGMISTSVARVSAINGYSSTIWAHSGCRFNTYFDNEKNGNCQLNSLKAIEYIKKKPPAIVIISQSITSEESIPRLVNSILEIERTGAKVLAIGPIPVIANVEFNETGSLLIPGKMLTSKIHISNLDQKSSLLRLKYLRSLKSRSIATIDPYQIFCDSEFCQVRGAGEEWYRDNNHLTPAGAKLLEALLSEYISASLNKRF